MLSRLSNWEGSALCRRLPALRLHVAYHNRASKYAEKIDQWRDLDCWRFASFRAFLYNSNKNSTIPPIGFFRKITWVPFMADPLLNLDMIPGQPSPTHI